ncbi:tRNA (guanine(9)-N(1))-methyltransferase [Saitoella coloradoensis]
MAEQEQAVIQETFVDQTAVKHDTAMTSDAQAGPSVAGETVEATDGTVESPSEQQTTANNESTGAPAISKRAQKRAIKLERIKEQQKQKKQQKKEEKARKRTLIESGELVEEPPAKKAKTPKPFIQQEPSNVGIIIDCSFDDKMTDKEVVSLCSQLTRCYSDNRKAKHPVRLSMTSVDKRLGDRMHTVFRDQHKNWKDVKVTSEPYELPPQEQRANGNLVYLTADSETTITELDENKSYIIGGIVDRNRYKSLCFDKAKGQGIPTAKLPIGRLQASKVLTVNQVLEIMLKAIELKDWDRACKEVIPQRKQLVEDENAEDEAEEEYDDGEEEEQGDEVGAGNSEAANDGQPEADVVESVPVAATS